MLAKALPFRAHVEESVLLDLQRRLRGTRWPSEPNAARWRFGVPVDFMKRVVDHWTTTYEWRKTEAAINSFPNFTSKVEGLDIHFILEKGSGASPKPLILSHGWPGSIVEYLGLIEPLAHPERFGGREEDAFTVIVPSLPGFGYSQAPEAPISFRDVGRIFRTLMVDTLGFDTFFAQGGDMGSILSSWMAFDYPGNVKALHLSNVLFLVLPDDDQQTPEEKEWSLLNSEKRRGEDGYRTQQGTRPTTLAYGLTDSPVGLAAWIMEKFHGWTLPGTTEDPPFDLNELLDNVMLYWIAGPNPASWYYISIFEERGFVRRRFPDGRRVDVPTAAMIGANDTVVAPPQSVVARSYSNFVRRTDLPSGGHFPSLENPERFLDDVRTFFRTYR